MLHTFIQRLLHFIFTSLISAYILSHVFDKRLFILYILSSYFCLLCFAFYLYVNRYSLGSVTYTVRLSNGLLSVYHCLSTTFPGMSLHFTLIPGAALSHPTFSSIPTGP